MSKSINKTPSRTVDTGQGEIMSRRAVLRNLLIGGCSLIVPITFFSACSRGSKSAAPVLPEKFSKADAKYQEQPKGTQQCSNCMSFISASRTCQRVEGSVSPAGWCSLWAKNA